jgi:hypothetical protein
VEPVDTTGCEWRAAYKRVANKQLPRQLRVFGWRLLHAGLQVGARRVHAGAARGQTAGEFACRYPECQQQQQQQLPPLATLSHVLLECPVAAAAWQWFLRVWQRVQPGSEPDVGSSRLMLLDDSSVWAPPAEAAYMWTYLRLQMLECLYNQASLQQAGTTCSRPALAVACSFKAAVQQQMQRDYRRVGADIRLTAGVPLSWLPGKSPELELGDFLMKWGGLARAGRPVFAVGMWDL